MKIPSLEDLMLEDDTAERPDIHKDEIVCDCCERVLEQGESVLDFKGVVLCESCIDGLMCEVR